MSPATATYVFCLVRDPRPPDLAGAPAGMPGASAPRLLPLETTAQGGVWLVVADVPLPEYGEAQIGRRLEELSWVSERVLAHEAMVEHFAGAEALVPMKPFTLFAGDERALTELRSELPGLRLALDRVSRRAEWGVRVGHDRAAATARELADAVFDELSGRAAESRRREPEASMPLILDAAFLVDNVDRECFVEAAEAAGRRASEAGCELTLSGPRPPYGFVEEPE